MSKYKHSTRAVRYFAGSFSLFYFVSFRFFLCRLLFLFRSVSISRRCTLLHNIMRGYLKKSENRKNKNSIHVYNLFAFYD